MEKAVMNLAEAGAIDRQLIGGKAGVLGELADAGLPVPPGFVVTAAALADAERLDGALAEAVRRSGGDRFAVRSSSAAEDMPDASYAGLYETYLNVDPAGLADAVRRCFAAAGSQRVRLYHDRHGADGATASHGAMAVLVQRMVDATMAGVAFTAHPLTGDRNQTVITAVPGLGDPLVSGQTIGEEWTITAGRATRIRPMSGVDRVLSEDQAREVARLAGRIAGRYDRPQDVEWAIDTAGRLWLLQARPMTALPEPVSWTPPGPGLWMRNFRLGEWLPEAVTPLFATWLLPLIENGYLDGMHDSVGVRVPFRYALINGWYYNATPVPSPRLLAKVLGHGRFRVVKVLYNALFRVSRDPVAADRAVLADLDHRWRTQQLPRYRQLVEAAEAETSTVASARLAELVDQLGHEAGVYLWYLAIVGGSAWKMEARLTRFARAHLAETLAEHGGVQVLLRGLPGTAPVSSPHAVQSADWYHPVAGELSAGSLGSPAGSGTRHRQLGVQRVQAEAACRSALADRPRVLAQFDALLRVAQRYAVIREEQSRDFTLAWPVLRACVQRLGRHLAGDGVLEATDDIFFGTRAEVDAHLRGGGPASPAERVRTRRETWQRQRRLTAPLTLGRPPRWIGDVIDRAVQDARGFQPVDETMIVGHPASAGRATGRVRLVHDVEDFADFSDGEVLVAKATAPAWTPLFARAAAVVTDGGTLAAHASLVAREYGIPAVVGTGDATSRLRTGQTVTVDGSAGTVATLPAALIPGNAAPV
jgi:pyruvate,water dikinase